MAKFLIVIRSAIHFSHCSSVIEEISKKNIVKLVFMKDSEVNNYLYKIEDSNSGKILIQKNKVSKKIQTLISSKNNIEIIDGVHRKDKWNKLLRYLRETLSTISFIRRGDESVFFLNQKKYAPGIVQLLNKYKITNKIINTKLFFLILKKIHNLIPSSKRIKNFINEVNPDVVLVIGANWSSSYNNFSSEIDYIKASKELKILNIIQIISWDNLTARGLYHYEPDLMLVWNKNHEEEANKIHNIPLNKIKIIGSPFMDKWFDEEKEIETKSSFFKKLNLDEKKPLITYLGSSKNISTNESDFINKIYIHLKKEGVQLIIRPHSANSEQFNHLDKNIKVFPKKGDIPDTEESKKTMLETIKYSIATAGINTTAMVDSIILKTPSFVIDNEENINNQQMTPHFKKLYNDNIFIKYENYSEFSKKIYSIINKGVPQSAMEKMEEFAESFCRPYGYNVSAGERTLFEIKKFLK